MTTCIVTHELSWARRRDDRRVTKCREYACCDPISLGGKFSVFWPIRDTHKIGFLWHFMCVLYGSGNRNSPHLSERNHHESKTRAADDSVHIVFLVQPANCTGCKGHSGDVEAVGRYSR